MNGAGRWASTTACAVVLIGAGAGGGAVLSRTRDAPARGGATAPVTISSVRVVRTDLASARQLDGSLGYTGPVTVIATTAGRAYTWLPAPGAVIVEGRTLYEVDGAGVPLLYGPRPAWRALAYGMRRGPDVAQLNTALTRLGYARGLAGPRFTTATRAAVRRWQRAYGRPVTGAVPLGQVVFAPGPLRVRAVRASAGEPARPGAPVLDATGTRRIVELPVPVDLAYLIHRRDPVTVTLPDGVGHTRGTVALISPVAVPPPDASPDRGGRTTPVIGVTVALADPAAVAGYTSAPVTVAITTASARAVLAVPVAALYARPDGTVAVTRVDGPARREIPVRTGLFAQTLVAVSGPGLAEGSLVEVPNP